MSNNDKILPTPDDDEIAPRIRLRRFRELAGKTPEDLAVYVDNSTSSYYDLEEHNGELYMVPSLGELSRLCSDLGIKTRDLFDDRLESGLTISPEQLISKVKEHLNHTGTSIAEFENRVGYEIEPSLKDVAKVMDWNIDFLISVCRELGLNWRLALPDNP
jgi:transcriptional regulator with XRE-family HTH domain